MNISSKQAGTVSLDLAAEADYPQFRKDLQDAFAVAVVETYGSVSDGPIPSDEDVAASFGAPKARVYRVLENGRWVGGAVLSIDPETHQNSLDFFYVRVSEIGRGIGRKAWARIEEEFPETKVWTVNRHPNGPPDRRPKVTPVARG